LFAVETLEWKYIYTARPELYHTDGDWGETSNLIESESKRAMFMKSQLTSILDRCKRALAADAAVYLDAQSLARLRAMGYFGSGVLVDFDLTKAADKEDPKDFLPIFTKIEGVEYQVNHQNFAEAKRLCDEVLAVRPDIAYIHSVLAHISIKEGDDEAGIEHYQRALELKGARADWHSNLGNALQRAGRLEEAAAHYQQALAQALAGASQPGDPDHPAAPRASNDPLLADVHLNFGSLRLRQGNCEEALRHYEQSCQLKPAEPMLHYSRGVGLRKCGRTEEAEAAFRKTLELDPNHTPAKRALGLP
jgi:Flp pilus assembly protein TadD